jgi:hypothetical protein
VLGHTISGYCGHPTPRNRVKVREQPTMVSSTVLGVQPKICRAFSEESGRRFADLLIVLGRKERAMMRAFLDHLRTSMFVISTATANPRWPR